MRDQRRKRPRRVRPSLRSEVYHVRRSLHMHSDGGKRCVALTPSVTNAHAVLDNSCGLKPATRDAACTAMAVSNVCPTRGLAIRCRTVAIVLGVAAGSIYLVCCSRMACWGRGRVVWQVRSTRLESARRSVPAAFPRRPIRRRRTGVQKPCCRFGMPGSRVEDATVDEVERPEDEETAVADLAFRALLSHATSSA
jgi:hypothetical protein